MRSEDMAKVMETEILYLCSVASVLESRLDIFERLPCIGVIEDVGHI
jgi:hypothetical protein